MFKKELELKHSWENVMEPYQIFPISAHPREMKRFGKFLVSKETKVLRRWESETWVFGFIRRVAKVITVKDFSV